MTLCASCWQAYAGSLAASAALLRAYPSPRSSKCRPDGLQVDVLVDRVRGAVTPESGLLEAAERRSQRGAVEAVDPHSARAQRIRQAVSQIHVLGPDRRRQPVERVVRDLQRFGGLAKITH